ncbi:hypothetical protein GALLN_00215 [Gallionellaceae bacterium]|nr:hypothetical protein GALLN_00215 [Gallionellaceae bacterium]
MINTCIRFVLGLTLCIFASGCSLFHHHDISSWKDVEGLPKKIAVYQGVFWGIGATTFREFIMTDGLFKDKTVYEIGTGAGVLALLAVQAGSKSVVATDIDPDAVLNAQFNAKHFGVEDRIDVRLVSENTPGAYSVLKENERFDFIISNPPWSDGKVSDLKDRQTNDEDLMLIKSIIKDLNHHLNPGGAAFLAIGDTNTIKRMETFAIEHNHKMEIVDEKTNEAFIKASAHPDPNGLFWPAAIIKITPLESRVNTGGM